MNSSTAYPRSWLSVLGIAAGAVVAGALARLALPGLPGTGALIAPFGLAAMLAAVLGGWPAGLGATVLGALAVDLLYPQPPLTLAVSGADEWAAMFSVAVLGGAGSWTSWRFEQERKRSIEAVERARSAESSRGALFDSLRDQAIVLLDAGGRITRWSEGARTLFGFEAGEMQGRHFSLLFPDSEVLHQGLERQLGQAAERGTAESEGWRQRRDGSTFRARSVVTTVLGDSRMPGGYLMVTRDVTGIEREEEELRLSLERARLLTGHLYVVRESERSRIAREMHDELGQLLTCLKLDVAALVEDFGGEEGPLHDRLLEVRERVDGSIRSMRRLVTELRPRVLDDLGLSAAVEWQAREFQTRSGIQCHIADPLPEIPLDRERATAVFRIFQEALTNVARHSGASEVRIRVTDQSGVISVEVLDNGRGITGEELAARKSMGLMGMRERAAVFGGDVEVAAAPDGGTQVHIHLPRDGAKP